MWKRKKENLRSDCFFFLSDFFPYVYVSLSFWKLQSTLKTTKSKAREVLLTWNTVSAQNADTMQQHNSQGKKEPVLQRNFTNYLNQNIMGTLIQVPHFLKQYNQIFLRTLDGQEPLMFHLKIRRCSNLYLLSYWSWCHHWARKDCVSLQTSQSSPREILQLRP